MYKLTYQRVESLNLLRLLAAVMVLISHAPRVPKDVFFDLNFGNYLFFKYFNANVLGIIGVYLFFMITGFVIPMMQERYTPKQFIINRVFRIYPVYLCTLPFILIMDYLARHKTYSMSAIIDNIFLITHITGQPRISGPSWTLVIEVLYYLLSALVIRWTVKKCLYFYLISIAFSLLFTFTKVDLSGFNFRIIWFLNYAGIIMLGSLFYFKARDIYFIIAFISLHLSGQLCHLSGLIYIKLLWGCALTFWLFLKSDILNWIGKRTTKLSDISYSLYLTHYYTTAIFAVILYKAGLYGQNWGGLATISILSFIPCFWIYKHIEKPMIDLGRRFY